MAADEIHWGSVNVGWDGADGYTLTVSHAIRSWPAQWLARQLPARVRTVVRSAAANVEVVPAIWHENGVDTWGELVIGPLALPLSDPDELRRVIERAADEADTATDDAAARADALDKALRRA